MTETELRENPYVGLRPFFAGDSLYFFGRDEQTAELLDILREHRFVGVVGSSGGGKSSLVRAGLLPALLGGFLVQDRDRWRKAQMKPGDAPMANLAAELLKAMREASFDRQNAEHQAEESTAAETLADDIREGHTSAVVEFLATRMEPNANLFLLVDQFEEIFAFRGIQDDDSEKSLDVGRRQERARRKAEAADFVDLLLALAEQRDLPIYVVLTMRTDFLGDCDLFYGLPEALNRARYLVPRMTREQLRDAVECPARLLGAKIAPRLVDHVLNELGDRFDRLPLLQHALMRTWDAWHTAGRVGPIDLQHFEPAEGLEGVLDTSAGGLEGALDKDAEGALQGLDLEVTRRAFQRLTDTDASLRRVRSPARVTELMAVTGADRRVVEGMARRFEEDGRSFLHQSHDGRPEDPRVDISHESLIRQWNRLRDWVDEERLSRDQYRKLVERSQSGALLQDPELQRMLEWWNKANPSAAWAKRYSAQDVDFDSADGYLRNSAAARDSVLEAERQRADADRLRKERELDQAIERAEEQKAARVRQRNIARGLYAALAVSVAVAVVAAIQWKDADTQRDAANEERSSRVAQQLVAAATSEIDSGKLQLGYLLAAAGIRPDSAPQTKLSVRRLLLAHPHLKAFLPGHKGLVWSVAFSRDGKTLATAGADGSVILWDVEKGQQQGAPLTGHVGEVNTVVFSVDGLTLASGGDDGKVILWNVTTGTQQGGPLTGHKGFVTSVAFSPDGKTLVSGSTGHEDDPTLGAETKAEKKNDLPPALILWDVNTHRPEFLGGHDAGVIGVAFSSDGKTLASVDTKQKRSRSASSGESHGSLILWDVGTQSGAKPRMLRTVALEYPPSAVAFRPNSGTLAVAYAPGWVDLFEVAKPASTPRRLMLYLGASSIAFSFDGSMLAVGSDDGIVDRWDLTQSGDPTRLEPLKGEGGVTSVDFTVKAGFTLASGHDDGSVILWDLEEREQKPLATPADVGVLSVAFSASGRLASGNSDGSVSLWDAKGQQREELQERREGQAGVIVAFDRTGSKLASASADGTVSLWDVETARRIGDPFPRREEGADEPAKGVIACVAFSPDGLTLAYGTEGGSVELWDVEKHQQLGQPLLGHGVAVWSVAFSSDGKTLASGDDDGTVILWDVRSPQQHRKLIDPRNSPRTSVAFSPDGRTLASGGYDGRILVWSMADTSDPFQLKGHRDSVTGVTFSSDGNTFASGSSDGSVGLWDVATHQRVHALHAVNEGSPQSPAPFVVSSVAFSLDGKRLAAGVLTSEGTGGVRLWDATMWMTDVDAWVTLLCGKANRNLTQDEWDKHVGKDLPYKKPCEALPNPPDLRTPSATAAAWPRRRQQ